MMQLPNLGIYSKDMNSLCISRRCLLHCVHSNAIHNSQSIESTKVSVIRSMVNENIPIFEKELNAVIRSQMVGNEDVVL